MTHEPLEGIRILEPSAGGLISYLRERKPINMNYFNASIWLPSIKSRITSIKSERNAWIETLLRLHHVLSFKAVFTYLGHSDPGFTLRIYTHLMPMSEWPPRILSNLLGLPRKIDIAIHGSDVFINYQCIFIDYFKCFSNSSYSCDGKIHVFGFYIVKWSTGRVWKLLNECLIVLLRYGFKFPQRPVPEVIVFPVLVQVSQSRYKNPCLFKFL